MAEFKTFEHLLLEATQSVEQELALEDRGWVLLGATGEPISAQKRHESVRQSRLYYSLDPLAKQAIRLWTDYSFGTGLNFVVDDEKSQEVLNGFWHSKRNQGILSAAGQRKSSDKLLVDGEVFFALFLGPQGEVTIRRICPLEITEIITDEDDIETVMYYKRVWVSPQGIPRETVYRSTTNANGEPAKDIFGKTITHNDEALVYHLAYNTIGQRGNPLLLPALDWIKQYRRFLASRVAIMLALARFAWKVKVQGGQAAVEGAKAVYQDKTPAAGAVAIENLSADLQPIRTDTGASQAYQDGRMLKLQVAAAVGIGEQYFGDVSIGSLATAKTVELPMIKMFSSFQQVWSDTYRDIFEIVMAHNGISGKVVDVDFPEIAPRDSQALLTAIAALATVMPGLADSVDIQQIVLANLGIKDPNAALERMAKESGGNVNLKLARALKEFRIAIGGDGRK